MLSKNKPGGRRKGGKNPQIQKSGKRVIIWGALENNLLNFSKFYKYNLSQILSFGLFFRATYTFHKTM